MAVSTTVNPVTIPFLSHPDPRVPIGLWTAYATLAGDVSAGNATWSIQWSNNVPGMIFNVEQASLFQDGAAGNIVGSVGLSTRMRSVQGVGLTCYAFIDCRKVDSATEARGMITMATIPFIPDDPDNAWVLTITVLNPGAGKTSAAGAWGYLWGRNAIMAPGGPIKTGQYLI